MSNPTSNDIPIGDKNSLVPFCPSRSWEYVITGDDSQLANPTVAPFFWIQAFFTGDAPAKLVTQSAQKKADGTFECEPIVFAYSGERVFFKGKTLVNSGVDRYGRTVTMSETIASVYAYGGDC
jgi:hypothetical protein